MSDAELQVREHIQRLQKHIQKIEEENRSLKRALGEAAATAEEACTHLALQKPIMEIVMTWHKHIERPSTSRGNLLLEAIDAYKAAIAGRATA